MPIAPPISNAPVRGTQSFVGIMGKVWGRPSLTALEILWRWLSILFLYAMGQGIATLFIFFLGFLGMPDHATRWPSITGVLAQLQSMTVFQPVAAINTFSNVYSETVVAFWPFFLWPLLCSFFLWNVIAAVGRTAVLRRLDPALRPRRITLFLLGTLRSALLLAVWFFYFRYVAFSARYSILTPAANSQEPNVVLFAAMIICGTLLLYVLWGTFSWFLQLAPLLAMRNNLGAMAALRSSITAGPVRGKLIEINLVMNIVRIALIVLAMVFSASPLPFTTVATQQFLTCWWTGVIVLYLAANDYFHVVRAASYLSLYGTYHPQTEA